MVVSVRKRKIPFKIAALYHTTQAWFNAVMQSVEREREKCKFKTSKLVRK